MWPVLIKNPVGKNKEVGLNVPTPTDLTCFNEEKLLG
jgi:hypothetical protein